MREYLQTNGTIYAQLWMIPTVASRSSSSVILSRSAQDVSAMSSHTTGNDYIPIEPS